VDNSPESNPRQPANNADPARIAYHYRAHIVNREEWDDKVHQVKLHLKRLEQAVKELEEFTFAVGVEHEHNKKRLAPTGGTLEHGYQED